MSDAFISYRRKPSTALAHLIQKELQGRYRLDVYLDTTRTDSATVQFPDRLLGAIDSSQVFVCLLANTTLESEWVRREIDRAYQQKKPCVPVFQEGFTPNSSDDPALSYLLGFDAVHVFEHQGLFVDESLEKIARIINQTVAPSRRRRWLRIGVALVGLIATVSLGILLTVNQIGDLPPALTATQDTVRLTIAATAQNVASAPTVSDTPTPTITPTPSDISAPTGTPTHTLTPSLTSTPSITPDSAATTQYRAMLETQTMDAFNREQSTAQSVRLTVEALSWTPTFTVTPTASPAPSQTIRPTARPSTTLRPTPTSTISSTEAQAVVTASTANLRSGPGVNYVVVGTVFAGNTLIVRGRSTSSNWLYIETEGAASQAWISASLVNLNVESSSISVVESPPTPELGPRTFSSGDCVRIVEGGWLREGPSVSSGTIFSVQPFAVNPDPAFWDRFTIVDGPEMGSIGSGNDYWWQVRYENSFGITYNGWLWQQLIAPC